MKDREQWEVWFLEHRTSELAVLCMESIRVLLRKGSMTAEDVHHIPVENPSIRGALMKQLKRMGLVEKCAYEMGSTKQSHGHHMFKWRLIDRPLASQLIDSCASSVGLKEKEVKQMEFCI